LHPDNAYTGEFNLVVSLYEFEDVDEGCDEIFFNTIKSLNPGGYLLMTVFYLTNEPHKENYQTITGYGVIDSAIDKPIALIHYKYGNIRRAPSSIFHRDHGNTLEIRVFFKANLEGYIRKAGLTEISFHEKDIHEIAYCWGENARIITTRKLLA
jgi:hypothetical protein